MPSAFNELRRPGVTPERPLKMDTAWGTVTNVASVVYLDMKPACWSKHTSSRLALRGLKSSNLQARAMALAIAWRPTPSTAARGRDGSQATL